ncbi:MAG: ATP-dependent zinc metalloprotease FtsH [Chloroflexi bacterium]|nr:ATP-dependent zinc metalloprotease FtsH [Chloroflexota bacterium]
MRFALEKSAEHLEKGLKLEQEGDLKGARYNLLEAAAFLYKAAEKSEPSLKRKRIERAESILQRAEALGQRLAGKPAWGVIPQAESAGGASEWMVFEKPDQRLRDVAGLEEVKEQIRIRMIYPFTHPELARRFGIKKGGGILLYGAPGTGKTMLARAVAGEIEAAFFTVKPSEVMSKWVGEAEQNIARLFSEARKHERAVIFIDEVESLIPRRRDSHSTVMQRVVPQILSEMEGFASGKESGKALLFMGATNEPWALDEAVLRPGRFDEKVYIPLPDFEARLEMLYFHLRDKPLSADVSLEELAQMLQGYSGADIRRICEKACDIPFVESVKTAEERDVEKRDLLSVMQQVKPSVSAKALERFERFASQR